MVNYRRNYIPGGTYFFTVTLKNRLSTLLTQNINLLRQVTARVNHENPYTILAIVILPDHIHAIWELPTNDKNYSLRWGKIKSYFTHGLIKKAFHYLKIIAMNLIYGKKDFGNTPLEMRMI